MRQHLRGKQRPGDDMPPLFHQIMRAWCALMLIAAAAALGERPNRPTMQQPLAAVQAPAVGERPDDRYPIFWRAASADSSMSSM
jgi:hypothetical protein